MVSNVTDAVKKLLLVIIRRQVAAYERGRYRCFKKCLRFYCRCLEMTKVIKKENKIAIAFIRNV